MTAEDNKYMKTYEKTPYTGKGKHTVRFTIH